MIDVKEVRRIVEDALKINYGSIAELEVTYCVQDEATNIWKVNAKFKKSEDDIFPSDALFAIDMESGQIKQFKQGWYWR